MNIFVAGLQQEAVIWAVIEPLRQLFENQDGVGLAKGDVSLVSRILI